MSPNIQDAHEAVRLQNEEHYEDLFKSASILNNPISTESINHTHCIMSIVSILHEYDPTNSPTSMKEMLALSEMVHKISSDEVDNYFILSSILNLLWHGQNRKEVIDFVFKTVRKTPSAVKSALDSSPAYKVSSLFERFALV